MDAQRDNLLQQLSRYRAADPADAMQAARIFRLVQEVPACEERATYPGHLTASAWVVNGTGNRVLLVHHRKLDMWLQPGGHADGELDLLSVALREAREECGIVSVFPWSRDVFDVDVHKIPAYGHEPEHLHFDVRYVLLADDTAPTVVSHESRAVKWFELGELDSVTGEWSMFRMRQKWLEGRLARLSTALEEATRVDGTRSL